MKLISESCCGRQRVSLKLELWSTSWLIVLCETKRNEICTLRNENLYFAKRKSVLCEMKICTLRNGNLYFPENSKPVKLRPSSCLENLTPRKKTFFHSVFASNRFKTSCRPAAGQG